MKVNRARGTQDFLPAEALARRWLRGRLEAVFERYGFEPLETPAIERIETLLGQYGAEGEKLIFRILKRGEAGRRGESDLALRYDLTVPLARVVAMHANVPLPFKRYQIAPVWRAERPQRGRYWEFYQCDVDVVGSTSPLVEAEILTMAAKAYAALGFEDFTLRINDRRLLTGILRTAGIPEEQEVPTLIILDKLDKIQMAGVLEQLEAAGLSAEQRETLHELMCIEGDNDTRIERMTALGAHHDPAKEAGAGLHLILEGLRAAGVDEDRVRIDPVLARGLSYYTGPVFEVGIEGFPSSIGGGGRYDGLIGGFAGREIPACGFSFGLDRILLVAAERGLLPSRPSAAQVFFARYKDVDINQLLKMAAHAREEGIACDLFPDLLKPGRQLQYASARGIPYAVLLGPDEVAESQVTIRDLRTREQVTLPENAWIPYLKERLGR